MVATSRSASGLAGRLAVDIALQQASDDALALRLQLARKVVAAASAAEPVRAALVVGSTALRRFGPRSDLDIVLILDQAGDLPPFERRDIDGVHVEIERLTSLQAMSLTDGDGWTWQLRSAARLGSGLPIDDDGGFAVLIRDRAAAQQPDSQRLESTLRDVYLGLAALGKRPLEPAHGESLRGMLDNLALLVLLTRPRRYQKPKWALADLMHAGQSTLVDAMLECYGVRPGSVNAATASIERSRAFVAALYAAIGMPTHEALLAMGHAPRFAEASYVSRTLDDAQDLAACGRWIESQYVAKFAARLAAALVGPSGASSGSLLSGLHVLDESVAALYREVFADAPAPGRRHLEAALACADGLLESTALRSGRVAERISA